THCQHSNFEDSDQLSLVGSWKSVDGPNTIEFDQTSILKVSFPDEEGWTIKYSLETSEDQNQLILYDSAVTLKYDFSFLEGDQLRLDLRQVTTQFGTHSPLNSAIFQRVD
ncbi:MAG: hypothetical protein AAF992_19210, partial [Bacteroidota bacterium]